MKSSSPVSCEQRSSYQLHFQPLFDMGHVHVFPCDAAGQVDLDALGERARNDYLYARTVVGREFSLPKVRICAAS